VRFDIAQFYRLRWRVSIGKRRGSKMFSNAVRLFVLDGFEIKLDPSWFLIAGLITWTLATQYFPTTMPDQTGAAYLLLAIIAMLGFFSSLLLHELAHSVVARRFGVRINAITLFLFGGVAELENEPPSAMSELWIAAAGPAMSVVLGIIFWALGGLWQSIASSDGLGTVLVYLATVNLVIAAFNLVPAFPMDGGRILRAYLWHRHGDVLKATRTATRSGMFFGYFLMALGLMAVFQGAVAAGFWYVLIGFFVLGAARSAYQNQLMQSKFAGKTASDVMIRNPVVVSPELTLSEFVNQVMLKHRISFAPVVADGVLIGFMDRDVLAAIDRDNWTSTRIGDVFAGLDVAATIAPDMPVEKLMRQIAQTGTRKFMVVEDHKLKGVITLANLIGSLQSDDQMTPTRVW